MTEDVVLFLGIFGFRVQKGEGCEVGKVVHERGLPRDKKAREGSGLRVRPFQLTCDNGRHVLPRYCDCALQGGHSNVINFRDLFILLFGQRRPYFNLVLFFRPFFRFLVFLLLRTLSFCLYSSVLTQFEL